MAEPRPQQVIASIRFQLPTDPVDMADALSKVAAAWQVFTAAIKDSGVRMDEQTFSMVARGSSRPYRPRKPRLTEVA